VPAALGNATSCALAALPIAKTRLTDLLPIDIALDRYGLFVSRTTQLDSIKTLGSERIHRLHMRGFVNHPSGLSYRVPLKIAPASAPRAQSR
jgi:hypothetical protein